MYLERALDNVWQAHDRLEHIIHDMRGNGR